MQTAQIKVDGVYAYKRHDIMVPVRFCVTAIVTRKTAGETKSEIEGYIVEDRVDGKKPTTLSVKPEHLLGTYDKFEELRKRQEEEREAKKRQDEERRAQSEQDRLALYAFVGEKPPKDGTAWGQMFRTSYGSVDISNEGQKRLIERIRGLTEIGVGKLRAVE